ncbi:MAG: DNA helicase PcrA [Synechococcales cyanobacterium RM1_1_8]|nr:DNA helicase PcrA [Synechococcales cyanobacterium RM1_1_8]
MSDFLSHLNPSQRRAAEHVNGPLLVVAGAGSGKTRALTYRIANLIRSHRVPPENILAVTFTNKAAKEMKERIKTIFAQQAALDEYDKPYSVLHPREQTQLQSRVYKTYLKDCWIGTFHSLCVRILRFDIDKYVSDRGHRWTKQFSIFDESDVQSTIKQIVTHTLNLDPKKFEPRSLRFAISNAKNRGQSPEDVEQELNNYKGRVIAEVFNLYLDALNANNALDFDDLIGIPVKLFQQNERVLDYWHRRFTHILTDEYQDTNRTQYDLIRLLVANGQSPEGLDWSRRSVFAVGDVDQSIYSFRCADFRILMDFQHDFGDGLPDDQTQTMVKLEENYRSTANILEMANHLIQNNTERIDKVLRPTRDSGEGIVCFRANDELEEADYVIDHIRRIERENPEVGFGHFAILYRTNAQSRAFEESLVKWGVPYSVVGGLRFYDRKEIKDLLSYLRVIANPADTVSLMRAINTPKRGVGKTTLDRLSDAAQQMGVPFWEIIEDETSVKTLAGRSAKGVLDFANLIKTCRASLERDRPSDMVRKVIDGSGYRNMLMQQGTEEAEDRVRNIEELANAAMQFEEENEDANLLTFLGSASLASDLDSQDENSQTVSLMTLHSSKGLEFPIVFLVGLEQGLFPNYRSLDDPSAIEEERRLCYVGITRAQDQLFITHASARRLWGSREPAIPSLFLAELPKELLQGSHMGLLDGGSPGRSAGSAVGMGHGDRVAQGTLRDRYKNDTPAQVRDSLRPKASPAVLNWKVGEQLVHGKFGLGEVTHVFGEGDRMSIAVKFPALGQRKIIDPKLAPIQRLD